VAQLRGHHLLRLKVEAVARLMYTCNGAKSFVTAVKVIGVAGYERSLLTLDIPQHIVCSES